METTNNNPHIGPIQEKWLQSLEQHPERQGRVRLGYKFGQDEYKACCLGELGLIAGICEWIENDLKTVSGCMACLGSGIYAEVGLYNGYGSPKGGSLNTEGPLSLASLNDNRKTTWPEIAKMIRENPTNWLKEPK